MSIIDTIKQCRKVVITGGVAVGKSSIMTAVVDMFKENGIQYHIVPEFIDAMDDAQEMLEKYLRHDITSFEFQQYVLNYYDWYFTNKCSNVHADDILLFERVLDDSVMCFANLDNYKDELSDEEFVKVFELAKKINAKYNIPSYFANSNFVFYPVKTINPVVDGKVITEIVKARENVNLVIGLYNEPMTCYERMLKRNRPGEKEAYPPQRIASFNDTYSKIYQVLMTEKKTRFADVGKFI